MEQNRNLNLTQLATELFRRAEAQGFWDATDKNSRVIYDENGSFLSLEFLQQAAAKLALISSEVSEALEYLRLNDTWEETKPKVAEELADVIIRTLDLAGALELPIHSALVTKVEKNKERPKLHGKRF